MEPVIALIGVTALLLLLGAMGVRRLRPWPVALRGGLAAMFTLTGVAHFVGMRDELVAMVPPSIPAPELMVKITGLLELAGAAGLLIGWAVPYAAAGLTLQLLAMFPANVYAAQHEIVTAAYDQIVPRTIMQVVFVAATVAVLVTSIGERRRGPVRIAA